MAETINIAEIAGKISKDIFKHFLWQKNNKHDDNFACTNKQHIGEGKKPKATHPADIVFYYNEPYADRRIYLHTDLKSYAKDSITGSKLRGAFKSLCMTIECACESADWRQKYSVDGSESHEVRGLLFVHNHDNGYDKPFYEAIKQVGLKNLPLAPGSTLHYLGPHDIQRLYSVANDIMRLKSEGELSSAYTFYYPDLVLARRQGDIWDQPATIENLTGPFTIIKHKASEQYVNGGCVVYYNRPGKSPEEFEYFLDCLSRYQMLESGESIRIRVTSQEAGNDLKSIFQTAKNRYAKAWGFDSAREAIMDKIEIDRITSMTNTYNSGDLGWRS